MKKKLWRFLFKQFAPSFETQSDEKKVESKIIIIIILALMTNNKKVTISVKLEISYIIEQK